MVVRLINEHDRHLAKQRVDENGFTFEEDYDLLFGKFEDGELVAAAATREGKKSRKDMTISTIKNSLRRLPLKQPALDN